jgi:hypothetical protein
MDHIFVLDQGNRRVVKFSYDIDQDTLIWEAIFGADTLDFPTSLDYADYGDSNYENDDIFVTDGVIPGIFRFSAATGELEDSFCGWGTGPAELGYPNGVAVSASVEYPNIFYVTDSWNHRVISYYSETDGPIMVSRYHVFPLKNPVPLLAAAAADGAGRVYVVDEFQDNISVLTPELDSVLLQYGEEGHMPGQFEYPTDIYIDGDEMQICEQWDEFAGIQSFAIAGGYPKPSVEKIPRHFQLYPNYPNPFNPNTTLMFDIPGYGYVRLVIYNILGQRVCTLVDSPLPAGRHSVIWGGRNMAGDYVSSGVYFARLSYDGSLKIKKMLLLK